MSQPLLDFTPRVERYPTSPVGERPRLNAQCRRILDRLRVGRTSNKELAQIALKYTGRLSEIRQAGHDVRCVLHNRKTGEAWYELVP